MQWSIGSLPWAERLLVDAPWPGNIRQLRNVLEQASLMTDDALLERFFAGEGDVAVARELVERADDGELHLYPGDAHLFVDRSWSQHDAEAAGLLLGRVQGFLARVG